MKQTKSNMLNESIEAKKQESGIRNVSETRLADSLKEYIDHLIHKIQTIKSVDTPWMTIEEASQYTRLSTSLLRKLVKDGKIPYVRRDSQKGRSKLFFHKKQVDLWMFSDTKHATKKQRELYAPYLYGYNDENN